MAFFDHAGVAVAYDCCGDVVVHLGNKGTSLSLGANDKGISEVHLDFVSKL